MAKNKRQKRNIKINLRGVPYQEGPPRSPFPQLKSRQARNYRRELAAKEANEEHYTHEESVFLLYTKLRNARNEGDKKTEKETEAQFLNQVARYTKQNPKGKEPSDISSISDWDVDTSDLDNNSLLNAFNELTTPSLVEANVNAPFVGRNGEHFLNTAVYEKDTTVVNKNNIPPNNNETIDTLNFTFPRSKFATAQQEPVASTPFVAKPTNNSRQSSDTSSTSDNSYQIARSLTDDDDNDDDVDDYISTQPSFSFSLTSSSSEVEENVTAICNEKGSMSPEI